MEMILNCKHMFLFKWAAYSSVMKKSPQGAACFFLLMLEKLRRLLVFQPFSPRNKPHSWVKDSHKGRDEMMLRSGQF